MHERIISYQSKLREIFKKIIFEKVIYILKTNHRQKNERHSNALLVVVKYVTYSKIVL